MSCEFKKNHWARYIFWATLLVSWVIGYGSSPVAFADGCPDPGRLFWFRADYVNWWTNGTDLPPLVTTSPIGTDEDDAGQLDEPSTTILYGNQTVSDGYRPGYRLTAGLWLDACQNVAVVADFFEIGSQSEQYRASGNGRPIIARPFYNVQTGEEDAEMVSHPDTISGSVGVHHSDHFQSAGAWLLGSLWGCQWCCDDCSCGSCGCGSCGCGSPTIGAATNIIAGYRYYKLDDSLSITEDLTVIEAPFTGTTYDITDRFRTENEFHGGEIGLQTRLCRGNWSLELLTKMAIGNTRQVSRIDGRTTSTIVGLLPVTEPGGLLTANTNIGNYSRNQFTVIPQLGLELGWHCYEDVRLYVGYNLIYWPHVLRAADQIDTNVDPRNLPPVQPGGTRFPATRVVSTDYWAQGINLGAEYRY